MANITAQMVKELREMTQARYDGLQKGPDRSRGR